MAAFGGFTFATEEEPLDGQDSGWLRRPRVDDTPLLGAAVDSHVVLSGGSYRRMFSLYMTPARLATLQAAENTTANFTDWDSTPDVRSAVLVSAQSANWATPSYGTAEHRVLVDVELRSQ